MLERVETGFYSKVSGPFSGVAVGAEVEIDCDSPVVRSLLPTRCFKLLPNDFVVVGLL